MDTNLQGFIPSPFVWQPKEAEEAWELKKIYGTDSVYTAGGTLLRTQWESGIAAIPLQLIDLSGVDGMTGMAVTDDGKCLRIGAVTTLSECRTDAFVQEHFPLLTEAVRNIAAPSIRNLATIGGNVISLVGDAITALLMYDPEVHWHDGQLDIQEPLSEWLSTAAIHPLWRERLLMNIQLPFLENDSNIKRYVAFHKVGRREVFTPSVVTVAVHLERDREGNWSDVRIAAGGGQTIPKRLDEAEKLLNSKRFDPAMFAQLYEVVLEQYEPIGDMFASVDYRKKTAANLIVTELWKASRMTS
ncbi:MAG: FAD binding domain-containing protein [Candidatus Pristimantibacillus sp.]